jgi:hypothetical protein
MMAALRRISIMRKPLLLIAALGSLAILAAPATAESDEASCGTPSTVVPSGPIDLEAIPMKDVSGPKAIRGVGDDDECDDTSASKGAFSNGVRGHTEDDSLEDGDDD